MIRRIRGMREVGMAVLVAALVLGVFHFVDTPLRSLETATLDLRFRLRGSKPPLPKLAVILIDDRSLEGIGRWPFSRRVFAKAIQRLDEAGARVVALDLLFAEHEEAISPKVRQTMVELINSQPDETPLVRAAHEVLDDNPDREFANAIQRFGRVVMPLAFVFDGPPVKAPDIVGDSGFARFDPSPLPPIFPLRPVAVSLPIEDLARASAGMGHVNWAADRDGTPRYEYVTLPFGGDFLPSISLRATAFYLGIDWSEVGLALGEGINLGSRFVPTDQSMRLLINYRGPRGTMPTYSFVDLIEGRIAPEALKDKLVMIGASFLGASDSFATPFGSTQMPGTERMAHIADMIISNDFIIENPPGATLAMLLSVLVAAATIGVGGAYLPTRAVGVAATPPVLLWASFVYWAFLHGMWLPMAGPLIALAAAALSVLIFRYWWVDREGRVVRSAFAHYMAPSMVDMLAAHPEKLRLGGETRTMTLLFCDVRGFTTVSEQFKSDPQGLTHLINCFLTPMTDIIMARRGTIDKYMGDCIMAFWNAPLDDPNHADNACASALAMQAELIKLNQRLKEEAERERRSHYPLAIGIGLNTGDCVVGNMGSEQRFDYSVLGDAVNLASRLEGQSKLYGVGIVIGEATRLAAPKWATLELDLIAVKGKKEAVRIHALLGDATMAQSALFRRVQRFHDAMLRAYRAQDWDRASRLISYLHTYAPELANLYFLYEQRIDHYSMEPPGPNWNGVYVATSK